MDLGGWLRNLGLEQYQAAFRDNEIDASVLPSLTAEDLKDLGVGVVGHRRKLLKAIATLRADANAVFSCAHAPSYPARMKSLAAEGLKFTERCSTHTAAAAAASDFLATIRQMGFAAGVGGAWVGVGHNRKHRFFFRDWPQDWTELYEKNRFVDHDILPLEARRRIAPFWWNDILSRFKLTAKQKQLADAFVALAGGMSSPSRSTGRAARRAS